MARSHRKRSAKKRSTRRKHRGGRLGCGTIYDLKRQFGTKGMTRMQRAKYWTCKQLLDRKAYDDFAPGRRGRFWRVDPGPKSLYPYNQNRYDRYLTKHQKEHSPAAFDEYLGKTMGPATRSQRVTLLSRARNSTMG